MNASLRISCVIPVYNGERFLGEALDSVFAQTLPPVEVIVVDDGSIDGTATIAGRYGNRITYLRQENSGPAAARNRGVRAARGDFIAFQDADDLWHAEKLARQAERFAVRPELEISVTHLRIFWEPQVAHEHRAMQGHALTKPALPGYVLQTMLARRTVFSTVGELDPALRFGEDTDWFIRARDAGVAMELMPDVLVLRRFHENNLTRQRQAAALRNSMLEMVHSSLERRRRDATQANLNQKGNTE